MHNFCGNCRQYLDGKCWKKNIKISKDATACQLYRPIYEQMVADMLYCLNCKQEREDN